MQSLKDIYFQKYASVGRQQALIEFQQQYETKKGGRFHLGGITYEVSPVEVDGNGLKFEISSKIPKEQLGDKMNREDYFEAVKKLAVRAGKVPVYVGMDDIVHKVGDREIKKRDYIRLEYHYDYNELYDDQVLLQEVKKIQEGKSQVEIPEISGIQSACGRLALTYVTENMYKKVKDCTKTLVDANENVRKKLN